MKAPSYEIYLVITLLALIVSLVHPTEIMAIVFAVLSVLYSGKYLYYVYKDNWS